MKFDLFADGIANVSITAGVVRIDFYVMRTTPAGQQSTNSGAAPDAEREIHLSVNLPLPTFVSSMNVLQRLMAELVERGVVAAAHQQIRPPET